MLYILFSILLFISHPCYGGIFSYEVSKPIDGTISADISNSSCIKVIGSWRYYDEIFHNTKNIENRNYSLHRPTSVDYTYARPSNNRPSGTYVLRINSHRDVKAYARFIGITSAHQIFLCHTKECSLVTEYPDDFDHYAGTGRLLLREQIISLNLIKGENYLLYAFKQDPLIFNGNIFSNAGFGSFIMGGYDGIQKITAVDIISLVVPIGMLASLSIYNLITFFVSTKERQVSLVLFAFVTCMMLFQFTSQNYWTIFFDFNSSLFIANTLFYWAPILACGMLYRVSYILSKYIAFKIIEYASYVLFALCLTIYISFHLFGALFYDPYILAITGNSLVFVFIYIPLTIIIWLRTKNKMIGYIAIGGIALAIAQITDIINANLDLGWPWMANLTVVFLSIMLGRSSAYIHEKAHKDLITSHKELKKESEARTHLAIEFRKLVYKHQIKRIIEGYSIEQTMPTGISNACVICFDIQGSTLFAHENKYEIFSLIMKRCNKMMSSSYDPETLKANAYLIKEMGDGFLCSVGFPFGCNGCIFMNSFSLAENFIEVFRSIVKLHAGEDSLLCSVGIAYGEIGAGFPKTGLKNYDLYGDAIVKAVRYESMRKLLYNNFHIKHGNLIIVQDEVGRRLSSSQRSSLTRLELNNFRVRDDPSANHLFYRLL